MEKDREMLSWVITKIMFCKKNMLDTIYTYVYSFVAKYGSITMNMYGKKKITDLDTKICISDQIRFFIYIDYRYFFSI